MPYFLNQAVAPELTLHSLNLLSLRKKKEKKGIVQWYHPRPPRRGAGARCPERCGLWLWVALVLSSVILGYHLVAFFWLTPERVGVCAGKGAYMKVHGGPAPQCARPRGPSRSVGATAQAVP